MVVGSPCQIVREGEDGIDAAKEHRVEGMDEPPRPGRCEILCFKFYPHHLPVSNDDINEVDNGNKKVSGEVLKVKLIPLRVVEDRPVDDGDHEGEG